MRYGYFWWLSAGCELEPSLPWAAANGNGGQRIIVVREQDVIVVMTAGLYNSRAQRQTANDVVVGVLKAARK